MPPDAGTSAYWGEWMMLRDLPDGTLVLDLTDLQFADPLFLVRMRGFIDWHSSMGREVRILRPKDPSLCVYLERMHLAAELPSGCHCDLAMIGPKDKSDVLIPVRRLGSRDAVEELERELSDLYLAHFKGPLGRLAEAFTRTVGEISDNATTHGRSKEGVSYVAAQRYKRELCVLAIGDIGIGIPEHMRHAYPHLQDDGEAVREATKEGVSGTGDADRGIGYQYVIDGMKETKVPRGELRVWSGRGRFRVETRGGLQERRRAWTVGEATVGTWVRLELVGQ